MKETYVLSNVKQIAFKLWHLPTEIANRQKHRWTKGCYIFALLDITKYDEMSSFCCTLMCNYIVNTKVIFMTPILKDEKWKKVYPSLLG